MSVRLWKSKLILYFIFHYRYISSILLEWLEAPKKKNTIIVVLPRCLSLSHAKSSCFWSPKDFISLYYQVKEYDVTKACHELFNKCLLILHLLILFISCLMSSLTQKGNVLTSILRHKKQFVLLKSKVKSF